MWIKAEVLLQTVLCVTTSLAWVFGDLGNPSAAEDSVKNIADDSRSDTTAIANDDPGNPDSVADDDLKVQDPAPIDNRTTQTATTKLVTKDQLNSTTTKEQLDSTTTTTTTKDERKTTAKKNDRIRPKVVLIKPPVKKLEPALIWGLEWWELICIIAGSVLVLFFVCVCCCAVLESGQIQRQEVRGPNGERLGFFQAPGRHIVLVMDRRMSRIRGNNLVAMDTAANTAATSAESAQPPTGNPPHAPPVQPLYPKA